MSAARPVLEVHWWAWVGFGVGVAALLLLDLTVLHRSHTVATFRRAAAESVAWIALGVAFSLVVLWLGGTAAAGEYLSG